MTIHVPSIRHGKEKPAILSQRAETPTQTSKAGCIAPELVFMILHHIRHPRDTLPDRPHVLPTLRALPLVCKAWHRPATEILYQRVLFSSPSSQQSKQLVRSIVNDPHLGFLVSVLCFPDLRFRACDYYRNERSAVRLRNYTRLVSLCPNLVFLRLPTNLQNAPSPRQLPGLPMLTSQTENLLSLHLTASSTTSALSFLPIHSSLPSLIHLTLANFVFSLESLPTFSRLLFPYLPNLHSLTLSSCLLDSRAAIQIFSSLKGSLTHLELWHSGYLPELTEAAFRILGPTLQTLVIDQFLYEYHVLLDVSDTLAFALPALTSLKIAAESLSSDVLCHLPRTLQVFKITALPVCACPACAKWPDVDTDTAGDMGAALAIALAQDDFSGRALKEIVLAGRCCAWHKWESILEERCTSHGITLVRDMMPGECHDTRTPVRKRVDALVRHTSWPVRRVGSWWHGVVDRVSW